MKKAVPALVRRKAVDEPSLPQLPLPPPQLGSDGSRANRPESEEPVPSNASSLELFRVKGSEPFSGGVSMRVLAFPSKNMEKVPEPGVKLSKVLPPEIVVVPDEV